MLYSDVGTFGTLSFDSDLGVLYKQAKLWRRNNYLSSDVKNYVVPHEIPEICSKEDRCANTSYFIAF